MLLKKHSFAGLAIVGDPTRPDPRFGLIHEQPWISELLMDTAAQHLGRWKKPEICAVRLKISEKKKCCFLFV